MRNKTEYISTYISNIPNYVNHVTLICSGRYNPIWNLKFTYKEILTYIYEK